MPRSISKGAFVDGHLLKKVERMNQIKERKLIKTWSGTSLESFHQLAFSKAMGRLNLKRQLRLSRQQLVGSGRMF